MVEAARTDVLSPTSSASAGSSHVSVSVGSGAHTAAPSSPVPDSKPWLVTYWPIVLFLATVVFAAGGVYWEVREHGRSLDKIHGRFDAFDTKLNDIQNQVRDIARERPRGK